MTTSTAIASGAGLRRVQIFKLDANGVPTDTEAGANGYAGLRVTGVQSLTPTIPDIQPVQHPGDDVIFAQDYLPPSELPSATMTTGKTNLTLDATLQKTLVQTYGEARLGLLATNEDGQEQSIALVYYRQALDTDPDSSSFGQRRWMGQIYPSCRIVPKGGGADQGSADTNNYNIIPTKVRKHMWGGTFSDSVNGATDAAIVRWISEYPFMHESFVGDGAGSVYNLTFTPISTAKTRATIETGAALTVSAVSTSSKTVTLSAAVANGSNFMVSYETSDNI